MARLKTAVLASSRERLREAAKALFAERGYEATSTSEIARLAGTSQSQLIKHFMSKIGLLEAIFDYSWDQLNPAIRLATQSVASPKEKLHILLEMVIGFLEKDRQLRTLFLLEGRRIRGEAHVVVFVPGFLEFIKIMDGILKEMHDQGELDQSVNPHAVRSGLLGAVEGMLRDQILSRSARFPASYSDSDIRTIFWNFVSSCMTKPTS